MFDIMYLADIEIVSDPQLDEYTLVLMHRYPCFVKQLEGFVTVDLEMGVVDEVDECSGVSRVRLITCHGWNCTCVATGM